MGRGAPSRVGGIISNSDYRPKLFLFGRNISFLEFFQNGCFEKDVRSYCANRLNDYSCIQWIDGNLENVNQDFRLIISTDNSTVQCIKISLSHFPQLQIATQIFFPIFIFLALISSITILVIMSKLSSIHPLCSYLSIIAGFDLVELVLQSSDLIFESLFNIKIVMAIQFLKRSTCQMVPLVFNVIKQGQAALYMGLAIDNCKFITHTKKMSISFRREWISNVCILASILILIINAQFFWTFDITVNNNEQLAKRSLECGFSTTLPPNPTFVNFIWPTIDHLAGEILPLLIGLGTIIVGYHYICQHFIIDPLLSKISLDLTLILQSNRCFLIITLCNVIVTFIRLLYYTAKYYLFLNWKSSNQTGQRSKYFPTTKVSDELLQFTSRQDMEMILELGEYTIKMSNMALILIKFLILISTVNNFRNHLWSWITELFMKLRRPKKRFEFNKQGNHYEEINLISFSI